MRQHEKAQENAEEPTDHGKNNRRRESARWRERQWKNADKHKKATLI